MIKYYNGSVFNAPSDAYVNTVNCVGVMGTGIALEFKLRYPEMYDDYKNKCSANVINVGKVSYYKNGDGKTIVNFPTKYHFKYPSQIKWIEDGLKDFIKTYKTYKIKSVAFPKLGCGNGGLEWENVRCLMERYLSNLDIDVYICLDNISYAEGKEKDMLDAFNNTDTNSLGNHIRLSSKQKSIIESNKPYSRFFKILETESIGVKTYSEIFNYFYNLNDYEEQITLF